MISPGRENSIILRLPIRQPRFQPVDKKCVPGSKESRNPRQLLSAPLQWGPEAEPELGGREVARLAVGAVGARAPVDMIKALARCGVDIGQARLGYDTGDFAHGAQGDVLVVDTVASGRALR